ncbi:MAG: hypothetical protein JWQ72_3671 [Polaromonas sp.]|nr:hypothetical protein [Polaromonas sp.]
MDFFVWTVLAAVAFFALRKKAEARRIALLGRSLGQYQVEKVMETLNEGYLRALGTDDPQRREQIWNQLGSAELRLSEQFSSFAAAFAKTGEEETRVSKLPLSLPWADRLLPSATFDLRRALAIHAQGIADVVGNADGRSPKSRAYTLSAEMLLMQHTCHWFCRSRNVASARMLVRHQTPYAQLVASVSPKTREAYTRLTGA